MGLPELWFVIIAVLWTGFFFLEGLDFGVGITQAFFNQCRHLFFLVKLGFVFKFLALTLNFNNLFLGGLDRGLYILLCPTAQQFEIFFRAIGIEQSLVLALLLAQDMLLLLAPLVIGHPLGALFARQWRFDITYRAT